MEDLQTKIENLKKQQEQAREMFLMCKGAIEFAENLIKEENKDKEVDKKNAVKSK
tara:strand:- start:661 stop:825 length:165 start_codon:yes stop_codon:yes gene_type:complete